MEKRPRIGLTTRLELNTDRFYLGRDYSEAVESFGGVPVHLGLIPKREYIEAVVADLDGILLPGSDSDVDPIRYGEDPIPSFRENIPEKDETDLLVLEFAYSRRIPVLGICFGAQILNVFRGGSLFQDVEYQLADSLKHSQGLPEARNSHRITIEQESLLANIAGGELETRVNSHHHQSIKEVGKGLQVSAVASDGVIECIEGIDRQHFVLGVQWHPELSWKTNEFSASIIRTFVTNC